MTAERAGARATPALTLLRFAGLVAALVAAAWTTADPDLWGHVRFGRDIVATRTLPASDPYSFTSDRPWINHEWLAEVALYGSYAAAGPIGLVVLKMAVVAAVLACIMAGFRRYSWRPSDHDLLIVIALVGMVGRYHPVRPQLFSLLLFAGMLLVLTAADRGRRLALLTVPFIFASWANLHGGYLVGLGVLATWIFVRTLQRPRESLTLVAVGTSSVIATLLTPYGVGLWRFLWQTVGPARPAILDWQPIWTAGPLVLVPWMVVLLTAAAALGRGRPRVDPAALAIVVVLGAATVRVNRVDAFFAIAVVMLLGPLFARRASADPPPATPRWVWAAGAALVAAGLLVFERRASCVEMRGYPEPQSTAFLEGREGRLLTFFDWGEYAIWHLGPSLKVSMDGRRETVYSDGLVDAHLRLYRDAHGATALVDRLGPDFIWLPARLPVIKTLESEGWKPAFQGRVSVVLTRRADLEPGSASPETGRRCFPAR